MGRFHWDHPRVRGEKDSDALAAAACAGSPPRARGKGGVLGVVGGRLRITPACAGKRAAPFWCLALSWDHPRVRGEKPIISENTPARRGSPPRARGKAKQLAGQRGLVGITPACAGKSRTAHSDRTCSWDHPRVRGEKNSLWRKTALSWGSPPRARGKANAYPHFTLLLRITPACAGKSVSAGCSQRHDQDHPRVRGEKLSVISTTEVVQGSPPRARGKVSRT